MLESKNESVNWCYKMASSFNHMFKQASTKLECKSDISDDELEVQMQWRNANGDKTDSTIFW
jgi:hypothetical protein